MPNERGPCCHSQKVPQPQSRTATGSEQAGWHRVGVRTDATEDKGSNLQALRQVRKEAEVQDNKENTTMGVLELRASTEPEDRSTTYSHSRRKNEGDGREKERREGREELGPLPGRDAEMAPGDRGAWTREAD